VNGARRKVQRPDSASTVKVHGPNARHYNADFSRCSSEAFENRDAFQNRHALIEKLTRSQVPILPARNLYKTFLAHHAAVTIGVAYVLREIFIIVRIWVIAYH